MKAWLFGLLALIFLAAGVVYFSSSSITVQAAPARRGLIREFVDERGQTRLPKTYLITMPFEGRLEEIQLVEGQDVRANDVVARIIPRDLDDPLSEAKAAVDRLGASIAENEYDEVEKRSREQAEQFVKSMEHTVAAAVNRQTAGRARLDYAEKFLGDVRKLLTSGAKTTDDAERAHVQHIEQQVGYRQDVLVAESMKAIQAATILLPNLIDDYRGRKRLTTVVLQRQRDEAAARHKQMQTRRQRGEMASPVDGVVLRRLIHNERFLPAGEPLLEIGRPDEMEFEADLLSQDVVRVRPGNAVEIYGPAIGQDVGHGVAGVVERIYPAGFTKISSLGVEQQRVKVIVQVEPSVRELLRKQKVGVGYRVRTRIFTASKDDALLVPRSALFRGADGGFQVFRVRHGRAALQPVEIGLLNDETAEVLRGLSDSDVVVLAPESSLSQGTRVKTVLRNGAPNG